MNQAQREPMADGAKNRCKYLRSKMLVTSATVAVCVIGGLAVVASFIPTILVIVVAMPMGDPGNRPLGRAVLEMGVTLTIPTIVLVAVINAYLSQVKRGAAIQYVPPVHDQIAALPSVQVLLRGSGEPLIPTELLRAAHEGTLTASDELLRPTVAHSGKDLQL